MRRGATARELDAAGRGCGGETRITTARGNIIRLPWAARQDPQAHRAGRASPDRKDLAAYEALPAYPEQCASFAVRCAKQLGQHGWDRVKIGVDEDMESERALAD